MAKTVAKLSQKLENKNKSLDLEKIQQASLSIREAVRASKTDYSLIVVLNVLSKSTLINSPKNTSVC